MLKLCKLFITLLLLCLHTLAIAQTAEMQVTATVGKFCTAKAMALNFGSYHYENLMRKFIVTVTCTADTSYYVGIENYGPLFMTRNGGNSTLSYSLYQDANRSLPLGDTIGQNTISGIGNGSPQTVIIFASIKGNQAAKAGRYQDKINIVLSF